MESKVSTDGTNYMLSAKNDKFRGLACQICGEGDTTGLWVCGISNAKSENKEKEQHRCPYQCTVHWGCYRRLSPSPANGTFYCDPCLKFNQNGVSTETISCSQCPVPYGPLKRTESDEWIHSQCAQWSSECRYRDEDLAEVIMLFDLNKSDRQRKICLLCESAGGILARCSHISRTGRICRTSVHVTCAQQAGFQVYTCSTSNNTKVSLPMSIFAPLRGNTRHLLLCQLHRAPELYLADRLRSLCHSCWMPNSTFDAREKHLWDQALIQLMWTWRTAEYEASNIDGTETSAEKLLEEVRTFARELHAHTHENYEIAEPLKKLLKTSVFGHFNSREIDYLIGGLRFAYEKLNNFSRPVPPVPIPVILQSKELMYSAPILASATTNNSNLDMTMNENKNCNSHLMLPPRPRKRARNESNQSTDGETGKQSTKSAIEQAKKMNDTAERGIHSEVPPKTVSCNAENCAHSNEGLKSKLYFMMQCSCCQNWYHPWCIGYTKNIESNSWFVPNPNCDSILPVELHLNEKGLPRNIAQWFCPKCYVKVDNVVVTFENQECLEEAMNELDSNHIKVDT